ncbi:MAG: hypothetical protein ACI4RV_04110 [Eubacteriales bacterium]
MKPKRWLRKFTVLFALLAGLMCLSAAALDSTVRFERVTSAEQLVTGAKYLIVGCSDYETDAYTYYALGDEVFESPQSSGKRSPVPLRENEDGTLSALAKYDVNVYPLVIKPIQKYVGGEQYNFQTLDGYYLNAYYSTASKTYEFSHAYSKSLPIVSGSLGVSNWQPIFREDGTVLFKTGRTFSSSNYQQVVYSYIRLFHYTSGSMVNLAFSGGSLTDENMDLPCDEDGNPTVTVEELTEESIPVKTYLYKEVCAHDDSDLTYTAAKASTCTEHGNTAYSYCSNCCSYLTADKTAIKLSDTVLPLAPHGNTVFVPSAEPTCTQPGNIAYTRCEDCGGYFAGNSTDTPISENDTVLLTVGHSYVDGVCIVCGKTAKQAYFSRNGCSGDGSEYLFAAEYNGTFYAMGEKNEKGLTAVAMKAAAEGILSANSESVSFAQEITSGSSVYIKIGENYLTNAALTLTLAANTDAATLWKSKWGYDDSGVYGNYLSDSSDSSAQICLVIGDGDPYFSVCQTTDETHIAANRYGELCSHAGGLTYTPGTEPTCVKDGNREYRYCNICGCYFSDEACLQVMERSDIPLLADGASDSDDDGICDLCGKPMPVYTKVESADEIVMGNRYILVAKIDSSYYVLKMPEQDKSGYYYDLGIEMTAERLTAEEDGTFLYNSAQKKNAVVLNLDFACECSDLDQGTVRYALRTTVKNRVLNLESYGNFCLSEYAKYGWRIALNEDGTAKMSDVYEESLEDWNSGDGKLCVYRRRESDNSVSVFFSASEKAEHTTENTLTLVKYPVYLYRLTETGEVNDVRYTLYNSKSTVTNDVTVPSEAASAMSNVTGAAQALKREAVAEFLTNAAVEGDAVQMRVDVAITASEYAAPDKETGAGASLTYTINPQVCVSAGNDTPETVYAISDADFDGSPMTVTLYAGGIEPQQIVHMKQDGTKEYFYPEWSEEVMNGAQAFEQRWDGNGNMYVAFQITEFSEIKLLETPEMPEKPQDAAFSVSDYDEKMGTVTVTCAKDGEYALIFADYEKGILQAVKTEILTLKAGANTVSLPKELFLSSGDRIFLWSNLLLLQPLCEAYVIK